MLSLYDSLTRETKPFPPALSGAEGPEHEGPITIYSCGPTVYHYAHIGNLRTFLTVDLLRRYLEYRGKEVRLVMNITDVGHMLNDADVGQDKMEAAAAKEGKTPEEIARFYEAAFFRDLDALKFTKDGTQFPRATENIPQMVSMIEKLIEEKKAYVTPKGDVYYSVASFPEYGKLSGNSVENLVAGARVEVKEDKRHPADFALWISNPDHVLQWKGPRGIQGYPGWHIECSAMAKEFLGETIDLHVGGEDLKFPHHECEIAQSEGANGVTFAKHWLHVTYLVVDGEKMSKSKGNFFTLQDLMDKGHSAAAIRYLLLSAHYRTQLNFTMKGLQDAEKFIGQLREVAAMFKGDFAVMGVGHEEALQAALDDDLNVSAAFAVIHGFMSDARKGVIEQEKGKAFMMALEQIFGLGLYQHAKAEIPDDVAELVKQREEARAQKDWTASDRLRAEIAALGWIVDDTPEGPRLRKA